MQEEQTEQMSREEMTEDEAAMNAEDAFICGCRAKVIDEIDTTCSIRNIVVPGMLLYDGGEIRDVLKFLAMYPSYYSVYEVVQDIARYYEECECE